MCAGAGVIAASTLRCAALRCCAALPLPTLLRPFTGHVCIRAKKAKIGRRTQKEQCDVHRQFEKERARI
jgi:hypothetical protein